MRRYGFIQMVAVFALLAFVGVASADNCAGKASAKCSDKASKACAKCAEKASKACSDKASSECSKKASKACAKCAERASKEGSGKACAKCAEKAHKAHAKCAGKAAKEGSGKACAKCAEKASKACDGKACLKCDQKAFGSSPGDALPSWASSVKMKSVDGSQLAISDAKGEKGTLVIFTCNSCPWVVAWEDRIAQIGNAYKNKGFGVIAVNANDPAKKPADDLAAMVQRASEKGFEFPYVVDATSDVARAFGATRTPEVYLFDGNGSLVYHGAIDDDARNPQAVEAHYLKDALEALLTGESVQHAKTKAVGCSIKFRSKT